MISSKPLAAPSIEPKRTRPLALSKLPNLEFGKSTKSSLPLSNLEQNAKQQRLNQHFNQVVEQQVEQIRDTPISAQPPRPAQHQPLALNPASVGRPEHSELLELLDLNQSRNSGSLPSHRPLALGSTPHTATSTTTPTTHSAERSQHKPLALAEKPRSLDVQLLTEHNSALLLDPSQQFMTILQDLLDHTPKENPLYRLENMPPTAATQVASPGTQTPNLAWQASLWF